MLKDTLIGLDKIEGAFDVDAFRDGDIFRWRYNEKILSQYKCDRQYCYWCASQIGIWEEKNKCLIDTYWGTSNENKLFRADYVKENLFLTFVANIDDLISCHRSAFDKYDDDDCVNLSHANNTSSGFYIKKGAQESLTKKINVLEHNIVSHEQDAKWHSQCVEGLKQELFELTQCKGEAK